MNILSTTRNLFCLLAAMTIISCQKEETKPSITFDSGSDPQPVFTKAGSRQTISFTSAIDWSATSSADWLTLDKNSGEGGKSTLTLTAAANETYDQRTATITLKSASASTTLVKTIYVSQNKTEALKASPESCNVSYNGGEIEVKVSTNVEYIVRISASWIVQSSGTKALEESTILFKADPSWSTSARDAVITFVDASNMLTATVTVHQEANPDPGSGEQTAFTMNCGEPGAYSSTSSDSPIRTVTFADYQYAYGKSSKQTFLHYVDFDKGIFTMLSLSSSTFKVGERFTLVTTCGDNGNMVEKNSESLLVVAQKEGKIWFEDKTAGTGYIIPEEQ